MKSWEEMTPRERDALIAEKVLGMNSQTFVDEEGLTQTYLACPRFTTDIADAWKVVGALTERGLMMELRTSRGQYFVDFYEPYHPFILSSANANPAEAICEAAIRAWDIWGEE